MFVQMCMYLFPERTHTNHTCITIEITVVNFPNSTMTQNTDSIKPTPLVLRTIQSRVPCNCTGIKNQSILQIW